MPTGFRRRAGQSRCRRYNSSGTIAAYDVVQFDENGEVEVAATSKSVLGICLEAATSSTAPLIDILHPGEEVYATIETGTMAATEVGEEADINSADGLTLTESNNDFVITGWDGATTTECYGVFANLVNGAGTAHAA